MTEEKKKTTYNQHKNEYTQEYIRQNYDQLSIRLPKEGEITRAKIAEAAASIGMSTNAFIVDAVREKIASQKTMQARVIVGGKCVVCGKPLTQGVFLCDECQKKLS